MTTLAHERGTGFAFKEQVLQRIALEDDRAGAPRAAAPRSARPPGDRARLDRRRDHAAS